MNLRVGCVNFEPRKREVDHNLDRIAEIVHQSVGQQVDLAVFPETAASGYFLQGGVLECSMTAESLADRLSHRLGKVERPIDLVLGFYESENDTVYNSLAYIEFDADGARLRHVYRKFFLPTYGVFDEERFVSRGRELGVFDTRHGRVGVLICEDFWHSALPMLSAVAGAQLLIVPSASPARGFSGERPGNLEKWEALLRATSEEHSVFCLNAQLSGFEGGKGFVGGSMVTDPMGLIVGQAPAGQEHLLVSDLDLDLLAIARASSPLLSDLRSAWSDLVRITTDLTPHV